MTPKQSIVLQIINSLLNTENEATVNIHSDLGYPNTPESINPAIADFENLKSLGEISNFERISSREFKVYGKTQE